MIIHLMRMLLILVVVTQEILSEDLRNPFLKEDMVKVKTLTVDVDKPEKVTSLAPIVSPKQAFQKSVSRLPKKRAICLGITSTSELKLALIQTSDGALILAEQGEIINGSNIEIKAIHERKVTIYLKDEKQILDLLIN